VHSNTKKNETVPGIILKLTYERDLHDIGTGTVRYRYDIKKHKKRGANLVRWRERVLTRPAASAECASSYECWSYGYSSVSHALWPSAPPEHFKCI
jgi:hypothetical protein